MDHEIEVKLNQLLLNHKMTYQELANKTGLSTRTISELVNNKIERIPRSAICKISDVLEVKDIREILDFKSESK